MEGLNEERHKGECPMSKGQVLAVYVLVNLAIAALGLALFMAGQNVAFFEAIGSSIAAAGLTGLLLTTYVEVQDRRDRRAQAVAEQAARLGLQEFYERRPNMALDDPPFRDAREIDILEISGRTISDHHDKCDAWRLCCPRAKIRVILLHPLFPTASDSFASQRDSEERRPIGEILHEVKRFVDLYGEKQQWKNGTRTCSYELRLCKTMPTIAYMRADRSAYVAPYLTGLTGPVVPHIKIGEGIMLQALEENFERLWEDAVPAGSVLSAGPVTV
jgi:hypothetical protein